MKRIFLFDLDGTITEPKEGITKSFQYALKHFGIESRFELKCFCTKLGQQVQPYQYHEVWRYGVEYDARDMEKIQKIENNLDEIAKWIEQNNGRHW